MGEGSLRRGEYGVDIVSESEELGKGRWRIQVYHRNEENDWAKDKVKDFWFDVQNDFSVSDPQKIKEGLITSLKKLVFCLESEPWFLGENE